jgi:hypothetical protein
MHRQHLAEADEQTGFLEKLSTRGGTDIFVPLDVATGNAPLPTVRASAASKENPLAIEDNDGYPNDRVAVVDEAAISAEPPETVSHLVIIEVASAVGAVAKRAMRLLAATIEFHAVVSQFSPRQLGAIYCTTTYGAPG